MRTLSDHLLLSASDLINFLECEHLTALDLARAQGRFDEEPKSGDTAQLLSRKGDEHELRHLERLREEHGAALVEIATGPGWDELQEAAAATEAAMRQGAPAIFQGAFSREGWMGYADFLERVEEPSELGGWSYEAVDTKLARSVKPYFVIQLCLYSELVAAIQGRMPERMHVLLGDGRRETLAPADFLAYFRRMRTQFAERLADDGFRGTYPDPVEHCGICRWAEHCDRRRAEDDHLSLVAGLGRIQAKRFQKAGVATVAELAQADDGARPSGMSHETFERLRRQAELQVRARSRGDGEPPIYEILPPEPPGEAPLRGFARLPEPSPGDVFFDIEGDPLYEEGLEYLWGVTYLEQGERRFKPFWGTDRAGEKKAFEDFVDFVTERRRSYPEMHVYHYAPYEVTALKRMMGLHATREREVDDLLREHVMVDLYQVVIQAVRISRSSYSIKEVEAFYMQAREAAVKQGGDSILMFEEWLANGDQKVLDDIEAYNKEDCDSTLLLREWLVGLKQEAEAELGVAIPWRRAGRAPVREEGDDDERHAGEEVAELQRRLLAGVPEDPSSGSPAERDQWLLAQLLDYHRREDKPVYWKYFDRLERSDLELIENDSEAIGGLEPVGPPEPLPKPMRSLRQTLSFPTQEHKIKPGSFADPHSCRFDPETGESDHHPSMLEVLDVDDANGTLDVKLGPARQDDPPRALIPGRPFKNNLQRAALREIAAEAIALGLDGMIVNRLAWAILSRELPRTAAVETGEPLQAAEADLERMKAIARGLDEGYLFIQGPPGSGKTYTGAHLVIDLIESGAKVGVTSTTYKAIHNLLHEIEAEAAQLGTTFAGLDKSRWRGEPFNSRLPHDERSPRPAMINSVHEGAFFPPPEEEGVSLISGTAWLWCREEMRNSVDYLVVDEAGQVSLADALALSTAARNLILLGDPRQLAQVSQGVHPPGAGASVLEHLLGPHETIPPERGIFLDHTRRMHPDVCEFVSEAVYEGRLQSIEDCANQRIDSDGPITGTGVRSILLEHHRNSRQSPEEAERIADEIAGLIGARYTSSDGQRRELRASDVMVVTPYNAQVRCLRSELDSRKLGDVAVEHQRGLEDVAVGTVDKFQGQEAAIVFFSMATSSGAEIPRNVEFLYSRNRLNVAVSRARCIGVLVASPALLTITCRTIEQMRLVNALCLLDEKAAEQTASA